jgi:hypothetical protein
MAVPSSARAARERKQKIFIAVGGVILLLLLAIQLPKLLGGSTPAASGDTTTSTVAGETTPADSGGTTTTPTTTPTPVSTPVALTDTDRPLPVGPGQLRSFSVFKSKDPFVQQIDDDEPSSEPATGEGGSGAGGSGDGKKASEDTQSKGFTVEGPAAAVTVVSVNGARQVLEPGAAFPAADPVFVLVAENPKTKSALIGVKGGAYKNGSPTTKLRVGKPLVLVNTTTGARYRVVLVSVGTASASPSGSSDDTPSDQTKP